MGSIDSHELCIARHRVSIDLAAIKLVKVGVSVPRAVSVVLRVSAMVHLHLCELVSTIVKGVMHTSGQLLSRVDNVVFIMHLRLKAVFSLETVLPSDIILVHLLENSSMNISMTIAK